MTTKTDTPTEQEPAALRATIERQASKIEELEGTVRTQAFELAGISPDKGIGKAIVQVYDGEMSKEAILAFAKEEYDFVPEAKAEEEKALTPEEQAGEVTAALDGRLDRLPETPTPGDEEKSLDARIAKAEAEGDWGTAQALKAEKINPLSPRNR